MIRIRHCHVSLLAAALAVSLQVPAQEATKPEARDMRLVGYSDLLEELLALLEPDAEALGCVTEIANTREIVRRGTSAHTQVDVYEKARKRGATEREALRAVVDWLVTETAKS